MDIVFVGAGRLATNLALALRQKGHRIVAVYSRTMASAVALSDAVGGLPTDSIAALPAEADAFIIGEQLRRERKKAGLTQQQLADKIGTKKSYISRVENGHADIQLSTLFKIFQGLGRKISLTIL